MEFYVELPKWPAMTVVGDRVTREQAEDILVRTDGWSLCGNDRDWEKKLSELMELRDTHDWDRIEQFQEEIGAVPGLDFLRNRRIYSAWIGGPHGWCYWDGTIFTDEYNIGKWPSVKSVYMEWSAIAAAFPYLHLRCQLYSGEQCEEGSRPVVEFRVTGGRVTGVHAPTEELTKPHAGGAVSKFVSNFGGTHRERGVDIDTLKRAVARAKEGRDHG